MAALALTESVGFVSNSSAVGSFLGRGSSTKRTQIVGSVPKRWCTPGRRRAARGIVSASAGHGFRIKNKASDIAWAEEYKAYLGKSGEGICRMAMEGHKKLGRGAVFVNRDPVSAAKVGFGIANASGMRETEGAAAFYVSLSTLLERSPDASELEPIVSRIRLYDPARQFVVVFETGGVQGADIVTPKRMPTTTSNDVVDLDDGDIRDVADSRT